MVTHDVDEALLLADRIVMMTSGPAATIGQILEVPFPRPRRREEMLARARLLLAARFDPEFPRGVREPPGARHGPKPRRRPRLTPMTETGPWHRTLCPYCGVGCGLLVR